LPLIQVNIPQLRPGLKCLPRQGGKAGEKAEVILTKIAAGRLLVGLTNERKKRLLEELKLRKLIAEFLGKSYNVGLYNSCWTRGRIVRVDLTEAQIVQSRHKKGAPSYLLAVSRYFTITNAL